MSVYGHPILDEWNEEGGYTLTEQGEVFFVEWPAEEDNELDPVVIVHGYPTCSYDWRHVIPVLANRRHVVAVDLPGFGLSEKPDMRYSIRGYADAVETVVDLLGYESIALVTHDMGNTVGGELLARDLEGERPFAVSERVLTNGSIYIEMAQLTAGQQMLLAAPDARMEGVFTEEAFTAALAAICSPTNQPDPADLAALWAFMAHKDGHTLLARTIRYIEDRRAEEARFTGAIETHPSPLGVVWGALDPVAVYAMTARLIDARPDALLVTLDDVGHFPMLEAPQRLATAIAGLLRS